LFEKGLQSVPRAKIAFVDTKGKEDDSSPKNPRFTGTGTGAVAWDHGNLVRLSRPCHCGLGENEPDFENQRSGS